MNTLRGRVCEVVETLSSRKVDVCCIQESRYCGGNCRTIKGKDTRYKLYWSGNDKGTAGVGEEWIEKVFEVQRVSDRIILVKLIVGQHVVTFLSVYAPQSGLSDEVKDLFFDQLHAVTARISKSKRKFIPRLKVWKLKDPQTSSHFQEVFNLRVSTSAGVADGATEDIWNNIKTDCSRQQEVCGTTLPHCWRHETWRWNEHVEKAIAAKRKAFKAWRLVKAPGHCRMQPNEMPDMKCTMLVKKPTKRSTRILTPSLQQSTALLTGLEERTLKLLVTNL